MPKVLITGASGFLGSWLVQEAISRGLETYAGVRKTSSLVLLEGLKSHIQVLDFEDEIGLKSILSENQFDYIIHCAGITRSQYDHTYFKVNADYTRLLAKTALDSSGGQLKKFIFISSLEAYGSADATPEQVVNRFVTPSPRTVYGKSKLRGENQLREIAGLPLVILRPTAVFGPGEKDLFAIWKAIKRFRFAPTVGDKEIKYSFIYVKDLARVTIDSCLSEVKNKEYFVSDGRIYKISQFMEAIAKSLNVSTFGFTIPFWAMDAAVFANKILDLFTGQKSLINEEQVAKMKARSWDCDISELVTDLGYQPTYNLDMAIKETTEWYLEKDWL